MTTYEVTARVRFRDIPQTEYSQMVELPAGGTPVQAWGALQAEIQTKFGNIEIGPGPVRIRLVKP